MTKEEQQANEIAYLTGLTERFLDHCLCPRFKKENQATHHYHLPPNPVIVWRQFHEGGWVHPVDYETYFTEDIHTVICEIMKEIYVYAALTCAIKVVNQTDALIVFAATKDNQVALVAPIAPPSIDWLVSKLPYTEQPRTYTITKSHNLYPYSPLSDLPWDTMPAFEELPIENMPLSMKPHERGH